MHGVGDKITGLNHLVKLCTHKNDSKDNTLKKKQGPILLSRGTGLDQGRGGSSYKAMSVVYMYIDFRILSATLLISETLAANVTTIETMVMTYVI